MTTAVDELLLSAAEVEIQATGKSPAVSIVAYTGGLMVVFYLGARCWLLATFIWRSFAMERITGFAFLVGIILTGMGNDGARGMLAMHQAGAHTIAQNEATCVVFGMPRRAIALGGVDVVCPLHEIPTRALRATEPVAVGQSHSRPMSLR